MARKRLAVFELTAPPRRDSEALSCQVSLVAAAELSIGAVKVLDLPQDVFSITKKYFSVRNVKGVPLGKSFVGAKPFAKADFKPATELEASAKNEEADGVAKSGPSLGGKGEHLPQYRWRGVRR